MEYGIPNDPMMLLSFVNTRLRDIYPSLEEMCAALGVSKAEVTGKLAEAGFEYSRENNKFW